METPTTHNATLKLTKREKELLNYISHGMTTKEIASKLFLSEYTVENHRKSMLKKSGAKNSTELLHMVMTHSIV